MPARPLRIASVNVNGVRAAFRKGMGAWLATRDVDILALQEVRAETADLAALLGEEWDVMHDAASAKGRAGVAIASRHRASIHRVTLGDDDFDSAGRWLEADYEVGDQVITVVSAYVHSGQDGTPRQAEKYRFLDGMAERLRATLAEAGVARLLGVKRGAPLLEINRVALTYHDAPVELRRSLVNTERHEYFSDIGKEGP